MLYDCWLQIARSRQQELALLDLGTGRRWTFGELSSMPVDGSGLGEVCFPSGNSADFVLQVLNAWRFGRGVCPLEGGQGRPELPGFLPEGIVHLKTTSATTGAPRLVAFRAKQLKADADNIVGTMGLRPDWPNLGVISLAHSYGFSNLVLPLLLHGIPLILVPSALPEVVRQGARVAPELTLAAVPALWKTWHDSGAIPPNVKLAISAGAPLPLDLEEGVLRRSGVKIHNFYGSTECGGIAYDTSAGPRPDASCVGTPLRNVEVQLSEDGCVEVRGAAVGETYWPESSPSLRDGVFRTGDLGEVREGWVCLRGRLTEQINVAGRKVAPETIERVLLGHPQVRACVVFGAPGAEAQRGETIVACVASSPGLSGEALKQHAISHLAAWQVPRHWWFVQTLEANRRGKISRAEWRKRFLERGEGR